MAPARLAVLRHSAICPRRWDHDRRSSRDKPASLAPLSFLLLPPKRKSLDTLASPLKARHSDSSLPITPRKVRLSPAISQRKLPVPATRHADKTSRFPQAWPAGRYGSLACASTAYCQLSINRVVRHLCAFV